MFRASLCVIPISIGCKTWSDSRQRRLYADFAYCFPSEVHPFKHVILVIEDYCELYFSFLSELKVTHYKVALFLLSQVKLSKMEALELLK